MYVIIFDTLLALIVTLFNLHTDYSAYLKNLNKDFVTIEENYIPSIQNSLWSVNKKALNLLLKSIINTNSIVYTEVIDNNEKLLMSVGKKPPIINEMHHEHVLKYINRKQNIKLGKIKIYAHRTTIVSYFKKQVMMAAGEEFLRLFFISIFLFYLVYTIFVKNINAMVRYFSVLNFENMDNPLQIPKKRGAQPDEIDQLQFSINQIVDKLKYDHTELQEKAKERKQLINEIALKNEELETIIYVTSHDLRSPLVNIQGFSNELIDSFTNLHKFFHDNNEIDRLDKDAAIEHIKKYLEDFNNSNITSIEFIQASAAKMDQFLNGLLEISRLGRSEPSIEKLDMNKKLENVTKSMQYELMSNEIELNVDDLPSCMGDPSHINQIFSNLIENAIKYSKDHEKCIINITGKIKGDTAVYCVQDNGIGIPQAALNRIFKIFYRTNTSSTDGEGIGLTIVKKTLAKNNGTIHIESQEHVGSKFYITLPTS
jgi:signal transduction histidine kinase